MKWFMICDCSRYPYVTGTSVIGIKYKDGILIAADMGGLIFHFFFFFAIFNYRFGD